MLRKVGLFAAIAVGLIAICIGVVSYRASRPTGWVQFSAPDGTFSILMPGEPKVENGEAVSESGKPATPIHFVTVEGPTSTFFCEYWDLSFTPADETDAQMTMAGARDGLVHKFGGKLLSREDSTSGGRSAQSFKASMPDNGILEGRSFLIGRRLYMFTVARPAEQSDEETQKYFNSFKLASSNP
jgi:hypothetical protein